MKRCKKCGELLPLDAFYKATGAKDGHRGDCNACNLAAKHERYIANPEPDRERARRWAKENPEKYQALRQRQRDSGSKKRSDGRSHLKRVHGITPEVYEAMLEAQGGGCAVCGKRPRPDISLHIDHDHATGRRRGLLCFCCNQMLGSVDDDAARLIELANYLCSFEPRLPEIDARLAALKALAGR